MAVPAVDATGLKKSYGATLALADLSLRVDHGEIFGFVGPNGAGKTTAIRILIGLVRPNSGELSVLGRTPSASVREQVGFCSGESVCFADVTVSAYLSLLCRLRRDGDERTAFELAERFSLRTDQRIKSLSRGNYQKIAIIQALMHNPKLLIMDEPTIGLDPISVAQLMEILVDMRSRGVAVLISSHQLHDIERISDRIGFIKDGSMVDESEIRALDPRALRQILVKFASPFPEALRQRTGGEAPVRLDENTWKLETTEVDSVLRELLEFRINDIRIQPIALDEIFHRIFGRGQ